MPQSSAIAAPVGGWLDAARNGDGTAWGALLEHYRPYLTLLAAVQIGRRLEVKAEASDLVQETYLQAHRKFSQFCGTSTDEFLSWLQEILASRLAKLIRRYYGTQHRNLRLEQDLSHEFDDSSRIASGMLIEPGSSPSKRAIGREESVRVLTAIQSLSENHREVLVLRHLEGLSFPDVAKKMNRSTDAATQLWVRAIQKLREALGEFDDG